MPRIKDTSVEAVKAAADFVEVVSARTQLRKGSGGRYMGRCPFHEERTPSFSVNGVDKLYYCFGCGAKGDLITFVRETEGLDFADAIEWLSERFRVSLEYEESSPAQDAARKHRERLFAVLDQAASVRKSAASFASDSRSAARRWRARRSRRGSHRTSCARPGSSASAGTITSSAGSCSRLPTRGDASLASRPASCTRTIRCRRNTS